MSEDRVNDEAAAIEAALGSLTPISPVERDRLMFLAGQASVGGVRPHHRRSVGRWLWPCATSASLLLALVFGVLWAARGGPQVVERVVYVPLQDSSVGLEPSSVAVSSPSPSPWASRRLCQLVLEKGIDALPPPSFGAAPDVPAGPDRGGNREELHQLLEDPAT